MLWLLLLACGDREVDTGPFDDDADGFAGDVDCDDQDPSIHPDAEEVCDRVDNDCDSRIDEGFTLQWYQDADGDGWGNDEAVVTECVKPEGYVDRGQDCDDTSASYHPNAREDDCEDARDYNCDGKVGYDDGDGDGFAACADCDDGDPARHPGADELCDGVDQDCDDQVDEDPSDAPSWWFDADGDGYGGPLEQLWCEAPDGFVANGEDCDDLDPSEFPGADEVCDGDDDDCDGQVDEPDALDTSTWYADSDGDGFGDPDVSQAACEAPSGTVDEATDCDDGAGDVFPDADEYCDDVDHDCDGLLNEDESVDAGSWYADVDGDGYGDPSVVSVSCVAPSGTVDNGDDCDDGDGDLSPDTLWYADSDGDGFGDATSTTAACLQPTGYVADASDCDDADADRAEYCCSLGSDGDLVVSVDSSLSAGTYSYDSVVVASGVTLTVTGSVPLVLNANTVDISGTLLLQGSGATAGPAGGDGGAVGDCSSPGSDGSSPHGATSVALGGDGEQGGGGGGGASTGGDGDANSGSGGGSYSTSAMSILTGGAGGGAGGGDGGAGGGGGGALQILAADIVVSGSILADGGDGADAGSGCSSGGGGGGAGGMIWLHGESVLVSGSLSATGGSGGTGDATGGEASEGRIQVSGPTTSTSGVVNPSPYSDTASPACEDS